MVPPLTVELAGGERQDSELEEEVSIGERWVDGEAGGGRQDSKLEEVSRGERWVDGEAGGGRHDSELDNVLDKEEEGESVEEYESESISGNACRDTILRLSLMVSM